MNNQLKKFQTELRKWYAMVIAPTALLYFVPHYILKFDKRDTGISFSSFVAGVGLMMCVTGVAAKISLSEEKLPKLDIVATILFAMVVAFSWFY